MTEQAETEQRSPRIAPTPPDSDVFAPYGAFLTPPRLGERAHFSDWLTPVHGLALQSHVNRVAPTPLPVVVRRVEHHPHAAQLFLPMGVSRYLVTVMPTGPDGGPDFTGAQAFVVPGTMGVVYKPGTWHAGIAVLDREASFGVFMWRGREDDDVFVDVPPITIAAPDTPGAVP